MDEEIKIRAGLDTTEFNREESGMRTRLSGFSQHAHAGFLHASNGAKEFHKSLHAITEQSGAMGSILRFGLSPIAGLLTGATIGFEYLARSIEDSNKASEAFGKGTEEPVFKINTALQAARKSLAEFRLDYEKFLKSRGGEDTITEALQNQLSLLDKQVQQAEKLSKAEADQLHHKQLQVQFAAQSQALFGLAGQVGATAKETESAKAANETLLGSMTLPSAQAAVKADQDEIARLKGQKEAVGARTNDEGLIIKTQLRYVSDRRYAVSKIQEDIDREQAGLVEQIKSAEQRIEKNNEVIEKETLARKSAADRLSDAERKQTAAETAFQSLSKSLEGTRQALSVLPPDAGPDMRGQFVKSTGDWVANRAKALHDWQDAQAKGARSFVDRLTPFKTEQKAITPENLLKAMTDYLQNIDKSLLNGVPVFGKD